MNTSQPLSVDEASRLAVTATAADLEYWARHVAVHGQVYFDDLVEILDALRVASAPQQSASQDWAPSTFPTLAAS